MSATPTTPPPDSRVEQLLDAVIEAERAADAAEPVVEPQLDLEQRLEALADPLEPLTVDGRLAAHMTTVSEIRGVPLYYERGGAARMQSFPVARAFVPVLEATIRELVQRTPPSYGALRRISSAGMYVARPGMHGLGRAVDWDRLVFEHVEIAPIARAHESSDLATRRRYWAFAAICRSVSSYTLHGAYDNGPHDDHVHLDDAAPAGFSRSRSTVTLLQSLINTIHTPATPLRVDGVYGPLTQQAVRVAISRVGLAGEITDAAVFRGLLRRSARLGLQLASV
jgi:hypothetical protein